MAALFLCFLAGEWWLSDAGFGRAVSRAFAAAGAALEVLAVFGGLFVLAGWAAARRSLGPDVRSAR